MLQSPAQHPVQLTVFDGSRDGAAHCPETQLPLPAEMLRLFEQITGWVIDFEETRESFLRRQLPSDTGATGEGTFIISDMSQRWPAGKPTGHRAKCDRFVELLSYLAQQLQSTQRQLLKTQSQMEALVPGSCDDPEAPLIDSFIPEYENEDSISDFRVASLATLDADSIKTQWINNPPELSDADAQVVQPPFDGWQLTGAPGILDGRYVNWTMDQDERIRLIMGRTDNHDDTSADWEASLVVDPLLQEYRLGESYGATTCEDSGDGPAFFVFDAKTGLVSQILNTQRFLRFKSSQQLWICSRPALLRDLGDDLASLDLCEDPEQNLEQLSQAIGPDQPLLILSRN